MKRVPIDEFSAEVERYLRSKEPIAIQQNETLIAYYIPVEGGDTGSGRPALESLRRALDRALGTGTPEGDFVTDPTPEAGRLSVGGNAPGHRAHKRVHVMSSDPRGLIRDNSASMEEEHLANIEALTASIDETVRMRRPALRSRFSRQELYEERESRLGA